jgi:hypothetical protein
MTTKTIDKQHIKEKRLKNKFFNNIWKTFYSIAVSHEKAGNERMAHMFFEICSNTLEKKDYFFSQKVIEDTLAIFSKDIDINSKQSLKHHLIEIKKITGVD